MNQKIIEIEGSHITLGQFLKLANIISSGGMAKPFLQQMDVLLNEEFENRRGKKLYHDDIVDIPNIGTFKIQSLIKKEK